MNKVKKLKLKNKNKQNKKDKKSKIYLSLDDLIKLRELNKNKSRNGNINNRNYKSNYKSDSSHMRGSSFINPNVFQNAGQVSQHNDLNSELIRSKIRLNDAYKPTGHMPPDHSFKPPSIEDVYKENMAKIAETEVNRINNKEIASKKKRAPPLEMFLCDECNKEFMGESNFKKHLTTATHKNQVEKNKKKFMKLSPKKQKKQSDYVLGDDDDSEFD
jgi:uncharacterized protein YlaI